MAIGEALELPRHRVPLLMAAIRLMNREAAAAQDRYPSQPMDAEEAAEWNPPVLPREEWDQMLGAHSPRSSSDEEDTGEGAFSPPASPGSDRRWSPPSPPTPQRELEIW